MKIAYITNASFVGGWAHSVQIVNMCKAFSANSSDITLVLPYRKIYSNIDLFEYYKIPRSFKVKMLPCLDFSVGSSSAFFYWIRFVSFYISARFFVWFNKFDVLYSRDLYSPLFFPRIILEQHSFPKKINFILKIVFTKNRKIIALTSFIKSKFISVGLPEKNIIVSYSAVDIEAFNKNVSSVEINNINEGDFVFGYVGTLKTMNMEKGVSTGLEALKYLPSNFKFLVVGGESYDITYYKDMADSLGVKNKVIFIGKVDYSEVSKYNARCDVFIAPFPENGHYSFFMSPLKIFEYMASKKPVIATTLPSLMEVLKDGDNAILIKPSSPKDLADAIMRIKNNPEYGEKIASKAFKDVTEKYTWEKRGKNILDFINKNER